MLADALGAGPDDPGLWRVADAGLEVWSDVVPAAELRAALPAALQLGRLGRVVTWVRSLAPMDDAELPSGGAPPASRWPRCWSRRRSATSPGEARFGDASVAWRS